MSHAVCASRDAASAAKCGLAGDVLRSFGSLRFVATGWSMLPTIWPGDTLLVDRINPDQIREGDVVLAARDGRLCAHRVVSKPPRSGNAHWITQGDAMPAPDRPVAEGELLGRVNYLIRAGRLIKLRAELSATERLTAKVVRRSFVAARALVYMRNTLQTPKEAGLPCQG